MPHRIHNRAHVIHVSVTIKERKSYSRKYIATMLPLSLLIVLGVLFQYTDGYQRIVCVNESISDEEYFFTSGEDVQSTCEYGNCSCNSLDQVLTNLASNVLINITTDVTLSSLVRASDLENVSIIGHNNPTVNCKHVGGIHFTFCNNCIIQGITWDGCGTDNKPAIMLSNSSRITIKNCFFQHSKGQAVLLSEVSEDVNINHCNFVHNNHYKGHGAAIHYSSSNATNFPLFTISDCDFAYNKCDKSLVYIGNTISMRNNNNVSFHNSKFCHNQGVSVYAVNQNIYLNGNIVFQNNTAENGAGIYVTDHSTVLFGVNSNVTFLQNSADLSGGSVFLRNHSKVIFDHNSVAAFNDNVAIYDGTIYSGVSSNITFKANSEVIFSHNSADFGGAIFSYDNSCVVFEGDSVTVFGNNTAYDGAAIYSHDNSYILFEGNSSPVFNSNIADHCGGAISSDDYSSIFFEGNSSPVFSDNIGVRCGGALYSYNNSYIHFDGNCTPLFSDNTAILGGAIFSVENTIILFKGNSSPVFSHNTANVLGGAIYSYINSYVSFERNSAAMFSDNNAVEGGAIILADNSYTIFDGNSTTEFHNNIASGNGGAIYCNVNSVFFIGNSTTVFTNNTATDNGGAIYSLTANVSFEGFSAVTFRDNVAEYGGAVFGEYSSNITFSDNSTVTFTDNNANFGATLFFNFNSKIIDIKNAVVIFNDLSAKWCTNTCLPYTGQGGSDVITTDGNGIVWCSDQETFICTSSNNCVCNKLENLLDSLESNTLLNITDTVTLSSVKQLSYLNNISITGHNNITVICVDGGRLILYRCRNVAIERITWIRCGGYDNNEPVIFANPSYEVTIQKCTFQYSLASAILLFGIYTDVAIDHCNFINNNHYTGRGSAIHAVDPVFDVHVYINNCSFSYNGGAESIVYFRIRFSYHYTIVHLNNCDFHNNQGACIHLSRGYYYLHITGKVLFENNVAESGAGIYINDHQYANSTVIFDQTSNAKFINNSVNYNGAAIFLNRYSNVMFEQNSVVTFHDNKATNGTIYSEANSNVIFAGTSEVLFSGNSATQYGSAIYSIDNSHVGFTESSKVIFTNNVVSSNEIEVQNGGTIFSQSDSYISFEKNSFTVFSSNTADFGTAIFSLHNSSITFKDQSKVMFNNNIAQSCGVLASALFSSINFTDNSTVTFNSNTVSYTSTGDFEFSASALCTFQRINVIFSGHSFTTFINNRAAGNGAVLFSESNVIMENYSAILFKNNVAVAQYSSGGAFACSNNSNVTIKGNSNVTFNGNEASQSGGAMHSYNMCNILFKDNSASIFVNNSARNNGGAILSSELSGITFAGNSTVKFDDNIADSGGAFYLTKSTVVFEEASTVLFRNNIARRDGGVGYFSLNSKMTTKDTTIVRFYSNIAEQNAGVLYFTSSNILFKGNSTVTLTHNKATLNGGALHFDYNSDALISQFANITFHHNNALYGGAILANDHCNITLTGNIVVLFVRNEATQSGGAGYFNSHCYFIIKENAMVMFNDSRAFRGGAMCIDNHSKLTFKGNSTAFFYNNLAIEGGGAINALNKSNLTLKDHIYITFVNNSAQFGGAIHLDATAVMVNSSDKKHLHFKNNVAGILGDSVYQDVTKLCNNSCTNNRVTGISSKLIAAPPKELKFSDPAICIDNDNDTQCNSYYVRNIMLGREIRIPACVLDYYNQSADSTQFLIQNEMDPNYFISGSMHVLMSCGIFEGISIIGNQSLSKSTNFSMAVTLNTALYNSDWKEISVNLIIELSPCHPGFWQYPNSMKCECYNADDIVFCSSGNSTIKRGYWFGSVTGKPTVTFCPINYCNFTCCETSNGYYQLSPVRDNQCRSHRSGTACGSCTDGYTLSFDSTECVNVDSCTAGQKVLVILLTVTYWIVMVTLVFAMMYYKVQIGYLYSITYYYSIVDILLSQNLQASRGLYLTVSIMSSFSKITPQFLGELCLTTGMSGIDQQFIHYIHPSVVILILIIISLLARKSRRISAIISRGIIHVICLLLLLSYTSVASTSLLLMRSLTFHGIDKVYTYVSPDIEYFHGRHLAYGIVALICTVTIVIGLPLLVILEPFLNCKFNFTKIKPLLDQFQGCYKDKYRCFAGYYMICRLVIITIVIANSSNEFVANYLLIIVCGTIALIHVTVKPYNKEILNKLDAIILHLIIFITALAWLDDFDSPLVITMAFVLVILPLLNFIAVTLFLHKNDLKNIVMHFTCKLRNGMSNSGNVVDNEIPMKEFDLIVDDNVRKNATICDM